ncbi:hypothetical protein JOD63_001318 [Microbacterium terrae]|uniref:Uncharacterized protein n=1 Tax=Microbacterium terrae TaxID=69369 RepID=A0A0M2H2S9_9MICO|nr:hypothetical protein RS81_02937 [Microbacterium terrae]MBP1077350.1 hypothetical protein [Microbacterium terrae]
MGLSEHGATKLSGMELVRRTAVTLVTCTGTRTLGA